MRHHTIASLKARAKILKVEHNAKGTSRTHHQCLNEAAREAGYRTYEAAHGVIARSEHQSKKPRRADKPRQHPNKIKVSILDPGVSRPYAWSDHVLPSSLRHGTHVTGVVPAYANISVLSGTSMANPHVSGMLALFIEKLKSINEWPKSDHARQLVFGSIMKG